MSPESSRRAEALGLIFRLGAVLLTGLHLAGLFLPRRPESPLALASLAVLLPGLFLMGGGFRKATVLFLAAGAALLGWSRQPLEAWMLSLNSMTNTVAIMVSLQLFTIPVAAGRYDEALKAWASRRISGRGQLFVFSTAITHLFASFLMLGSIPVSMALLGPTIKSRMTRHERFLSVALTRGYVLAALWAPGAINMYLVVQATGVPWSAILLPGFLLALCGLALSIYLESRPGGVIADEGAPEQGAGESRAPAGGAGEGASALRHILVVAGGIVLAVLALERLGVGAGYSRIMLGGAGVSLAWMLALALGPRKARAPRGALKAASRACWEAGIMKIADMGPFFVAMGLFSGALQASGLLDAVSPAFQSAASALGFGAALALPLAIIALSLVGLHPFITIVMFGQILGRAGLPLRPLTIALSLAAGAGAAYMVSPFAGIIMSVARYTGRSAADVALRWNWRYALLFSALGVAFSLGWGRLFG